MRDRKMAYRTFVLVVGFFGAVALYASPAFAGDNCSALGLGNKNAIHAA